MACAPGATAQSSYCSAEKGRHLRRALQIARKPGTGKQEAVAAKNWVAKLRKRASSSGSFVSTLWFSKLDLDFGVSDPSDVTDDIACKKGG